MLSNSHHAAANIALKLLSTTAMALLICMGAAAAQSGGDVRKNDRDYEKQRDAQDLSPIKPIRKVGDSSWPPAVQAAQKAAEDKKTQPPEAGQTISAESNKPAQPIAPKADPQPSTAATAPVVSPQPANTAPTPTNAANQPSTTQPNNTAATSMPPERTNASIRLGTDANGKVVINDDQQRQITAALRKQNVKPVNLTVSVQAGSALPANVQLSAVSADIVNVLPQFRGYAYFMTRDEVYIVDPGTNRIVALLPVKTTEIATRPATTGTVSATAAPVSTTPATSPAPAQTQQVTTTTSTKVRRVDDLIGIEAAIDLEMRRKGIVARGTTGSATGQTVVIEQQPTTVYRVETRRWRPWFAGGRPGAPYINSQN